MTAATWVTMVGILLFVWGGFVAAVVTAVRKESTKAASVKEGGSSVPDPSR